MDSLQKVGEIRSEGSDTRGGVVKPPFIGQIVTLVPPTNHAYLEQIFWDTIAGLGRTSNTTTREWVATLVRWAKILWEVVYEPYLGE